MVRVFRRNTMSVGLLLLVTVSHAHEDAKAHNIGKRSARRAASGKDHGKGRPSARFALDRDGAAMTLDDTMDDR